MRLLLAKFVKVNQRPFEQIVTVNQLFRQELMRTFDRVFARISRSLASTGFDQLQTKAKERAKVLHSVLNRVSDASSPRPHHSLTLPINEHC